MNRHPDAYERSMTSQVIDTGLFAPEVTEAAFRATDPVTSMAAAADATKRLPRTRSLVLAALATLRQATDFELADATGLQQTSAGKRRLELERAGLVERVVGVTRPAPSGSAAQVWQITPAGVRAARELAA